jgi:bifunctional non-homologous end joining protein LigD
MAGVSRRTRTSGQSAPDSESNESNLPPLRFIATMQPALVDEAPAGPGWMHEIKYDGYQTQLHVGAAGVRAFSRNGHDWTSKYEPIIRDARAIPARSAIIDGEVCVQDERGVTDFSALPGAIRSRPADLVFFAFFQLADQHGLEGIVSKRKGSRYTSGSTTAWLKTKCWHVETMDVIGVEKDRDGIPYALLADEAGYRGTAFIGLPGSMRTAFWQFVEGRTAEVPVIKSRTKATWLQPGMKATVRYLKGSDKLRHAVVQRVDVER